MIPAVPTHVLIVAGDGHVAAATRVLLDPRKVCHITVLGVRPPISARPGFWLWSLVGQVPQPIADDYFRIADDAAMRAIDRELASLREWAVPVSHVQRDGPPVEAILHTAQEAGADLIVIAADPGPFGIAVQVIRRARCAVLTVPPYAARPPHRGRRARAMDWFGNARHIGVDRGVLVPRRG
jgi:nucleotide-binding universal stress UspA family protein